MWMAEKIAEIIPNPSLFSIGADSFVHGAMAKKNAGLGFGSILHFATTDIVTLSAICVLIFGQRHIRLFRNAPIQPSFA